MSGEVARQQRTGGVRRLDRSKDYSSITGPSGHCGFEQDGVLFGLNGLPMEQSLLDMIDCKQSPKVNQPVDGGGRARAAPVEEAGPRSIHDPSVLAEIAGLAAIAPQGGVFIEVGVYNGGSAYVIAKVARTRSAKVWLYDTFEGLPGQTDGDVYGEGDLGDSSAADVMNAIPSAEVVVGVFPDSVVDEPGKIAFAHLDVKQQQSYRDAVPWVLDRLMPGGVLLLQDYGSAPKVTEWLDEILGAGNINRTASGAGFFMQPRQ